MASSGFRSKSRASSDVAAAGMRRSRAAHQLIDHLPDADAIQTFRKLVVNKGSATSWMGHTIRQKTPFVRPSPRVDHEVAANLPLGTEVFINGTGLRVTRSDKSLADGE